MNALFVYGTLKRGEVRERCWPRLPQNVSAAVVRAHLYDLGPYPALAPGDDHVAGELWTFDEIDMPSTLQVLDRVEGYADAPSDWYVRRIIPCELPTGEIVHAWTYFFARGEKLASAERIVAAEDGLCRWSGGADVSESANEDDFI